MGWGKTLNLDWIERDRDERKTCYDAPSHASLMEKKVENKKLRK